MENINVMPPVNQVSVAAKPKNYFVIAFVISIAAYASDFLYGIVNSVLTSFLDYEIRTIIGSIMGLFNVALCSCIVFLGFYLWSKNKLAAFRFTGVYFCVVYLIDELLSLITEVIYYICWSSGNYNVYGILSGIIGFVMSLVSIVAVPFVYNILNKRTTNHTVYPQQKNKVVGIAVASVLIYSVVYLSYVVYSIYSYVSYSTNAQYLIYSIVSFFLTVVAVAVIAVLAFGFRKDGKDIIAMLALVFFPRVIINIILSVNSGVISIINVFTSLSILWTINSVLMLLLIVGGSIAVICFTVTKFFPVVSASPVQPAYSPVAQTPFAEVQNFAPVTPVFPSAPSSTEASPESNYIKTEINENNSDEDFDMTIRM